MWGRLAVLHLIDADRIAAMQKGRLHQIKHVYCDLLLLTSFQLKFPKFRVSLSHVQ
jgi:hypothetical protein